MRARSLRGRVHRQDPLCIYGDGESEGTMRHLFTAVYVRMSRARYRAPIISARRATARIFNSAQEGEGGEAGRRRRGFIRRAGIIRRCQLNRRIIGAN